MPSTRRMLKSPFLLEKSKLSRIIDILKARFDQAGVVPHFNFQVQLRGQRLIQTSAVEEVFAIDNAKKAPIEDLYLTCSDSDDPKVTTDHIVSVDFDGTSPVAVVIAIRGKDPEWVTETFAATEEQVERAMQRSTFTRLTYNRALTTFLLVTGFVMALFVYVDLMYSHAPTRLTNGMWLTDQDIKELEPLISSGNLTSEKAAEILSRQIRNVAKARREPTPISALLKWKTMFVLVPCFLVLGAVLYLYFVCYPLAVFLWGDAEDWYKEIVGRRNVIWTCILIALVVGVLGNLFVLGLGG